MKGSSPMRGRMRQRVTFERNFSVLQAGTTDIDGFGQKLGDWRELCTVSCWAWQGATSRKTTVGEVRTVTVDSPGMVIPLGTDVTEADRVKLVTDRNGLQLMGVMGIEFVSTRQTHMELSLRAVT